MKTAFAAMGCLFCVLSVLAGEAPENPEAPEKPEAAPADAAAPEGAEPKPVIAVFDFESQGDENALGKWVAANFRARIVRKGLYTIVDEMDVTAAVEDGEFEPKYGGQLKEVVDFAHERFKCDLAMWGAVRMQGEKLLISVKVAAVKDEPEVLMDDTFGAENRHVTSAVVIEVLRLLAGEEKPKDDYNPDWDKAWAEGPNLVKNPGFELADGDHPAGWDAWGRDYHHNMAHWVEAPGPDGRGKCMKFAMNADIAGSYGVAYYSEPIDITHGRRYRFSVRVRSEGPTVKIFLKHYAYFEPVGDEKEGQWRETRRAPLNCHGADRQWRTFTRDFMPHRNDAHDPKQTRVELYAYWPEGVVYFDDVVMKKIE